MWAPTNAGELVIFDGEDEKGWDCKHSLDFGESSGNELSRLGHFYGQNPGDLRSLEKEIF